MAEKSTVSPWIRERLPEVKVTRARNEVTVTMPSGIPSWQVGFLIDAALVRAGLHPNQVS